jgi:hypothetical protein
VAETDVPNGKPPKQAICVIEAYDEVHEKVFETRSTFQEGEEEWLHDPASGWLRLVRFPADPSLPALADVLAEPGRATVVRYRPGKRCTIRFDDEQGQPIAYAKLFPDERGQRLLAEGRALWQASCRGELGVRVPCPLRWDDAQSTLWQRPVQGRAVQGSLYGPHGVELAERMGRAAASIAISSLRPHMTFDGNDQLQDTAKQGQELCRRVPWLTGAVRRLLDELAAIHTSVHTVGGPRPLATIHGAPHAHQWLEEDGQLGLVDFDGFTLGERELDIATFWSEIDFERRSKVHGAAVNRAFLAGYEAVAGSVDRRLLKAYCAHKRLSKALKYAYAVHPEGDVRAEQTLGRALVSVLSCAEE